MKRWIIPLTCCLATCAQAQDYPAPIQALGSKGITVKGVLPAPAGFQGYLADYQGQPMPVYLLPDGKHVVIGELLDDKGNDLTQSAMRTAVRPTLDEATWNDLGNATWIAEGSTTTKRVVYVFTDTECPYCHKLWLAMQPLLAKGDVQVRYVMVAVIAPKSLNRAAAILDSTDPKAMLQQQETTFGHSTVAPEDVIPAETEKHIGANAQLMSKLGIDGTPATIYKDSAGTIHLVQGMMPEDQMKEIFED